VKILVVADREERSLWDFWSKTTAEKMSDVSLILSAGDLDADYLEFLVTMLNVPLVYVRGNHDTGYAEKAPGGCIDADGIPVTVECHDRSSGDPEGSVRSVRILGLGGSMRYHPNASDMYTENEMRARMRRAEFRLRTDRFRGAGEGFDILLTHAPCKGYGDLDERLIGTDPDTIEQVELITGCTGTSGDLRTAIASAMPYVPEEFPIARVVGIAVLVLAAVISVSLTVVIKCKRRKNG
jgi:hypothetical protein